MQFIPKFDNAVGWPSVAVRGLLIWKFAYENVLVLVQKNLCGVSELRVASSGVFFRLLVQRRCHVLMVHGSEKAQTIKWASGTLPDEDGVFGGTLSISGLRP